MELELYACCQVVYPLGPVWITQDGRIHPRHAEPHKEKQSQIFSICAASQLSSTEMDITPEVSPLELEIGT